jgi:polyhydroxybutyrate depolymerase
MDAELSIDRRRVFAAGLSNGASMVYRLACERPELVAAVAPVSGTMSGPVANVCPKGEPVSIIAMHGTEDPIVPYGSTIRNDLATWIHRDACPTPPSTSRRPDADPTDGTQTRVELYQRCAADTAIAVHTIEGGGHAWPGGETMFDFVRRGNTPRDFDAGELIWDFFKRHQRSHN